MLQLSTCSNRSFSDETVKNFSRVSCRFGQSTNICLTVSGSLQDLQTGCAVAKQSRTNLGREISMHDATTVNVLQTFGNVARETDTNWPRQFSRLVGNQLLQVASVHKLSSAPSALFTIIDIPTFTPSTAGSRASKVSGPCIWKYLSENAVSAMALPAST